MRKKIRATTTRKPSFANVSWSISVPTLRLHSESFQTDGKSAIESNFIFSVEQRELELLQRALRREDFQLVEICGSCPNEEPECEFTLEYDDPEDQDSLVQFVSEVKNKFSNRFAIRISAVSLFAPKYVEIILTTAKPLAVKAEPVSPQNWRLYELIKHLDAEGHEAPNHEEKERALKLHHEAPTSDSNQESKKQKLKETINPRVWFEK